MLFNKLVCRNISDTCLVLGAGIFLREGKVRIKMEDYYAKENSRYKI